MYSFERFTNAGNQAVTEDTMRRVAPSIFAESPWQKMSEQYQFIPTIDVVRAMQHEGFQVHKVMQSRSRIEGKGDFTKHMIRFRKQDQQLVVGDTFPEVILVNSHDGSSSYKLYAGMFRLACLNGMVCSLGQAHEYKTRHSGDILGEIVEASYKIIKEFPALQDAVTTWINKGITSQQQLAYAEAAATLRWEADQAQPEAQQLLTVRRRADQEQKQTLWGTYQRVQEALVKGGNRYSQKDERGRVTGRRSTRAVTGIDQDVKLNRALWQLTEKMASLV